jgi:hypothetical protein
LYFLLPHWSIIATLKQRSKLTNITVKVSNFGPHGNFGVFLASSVASMDELCTQNEQNRICRSKVFPQLLFSSFFCRTRFNDSKPIQKRGPKFPWGPKLGALTVTLERWEQSFQTVLIFESFVWET